MASLPVSRQQWKCRCRDAPAAASRLDAVSSPFEECRSRRGFGTARALSQKPGIAKCTSSSLLKPLDDWRKDACCCEDATEACTSMSVATLSRMAPSNQKAAPGTLRPRASVCQRLRTSMQVFIMAFFDGADDRSGSPPAGISRHGTTSPPGTNASSVAAMRGAMAERHTSTAVHGVDDDDDDGDDESRRRSPAAAEEEE
jgi:hypothetical protein